MYSIAASVESISFFVTFFVKQYIDIPDKNTAKNINSFIQFVKDKPIILNINGTYAVTGL